MITLSYNFQSREKTLTCKIVKLSHHFNCLPSFFLIAIPLLAFEVFALTLEPIAAAPAPYGYLFY